MSRILPVGIQDFPTIRETNNVYVDKTKIIYNFITGAYGTYFLSRPRRFGKSLLCSTLEAIFEGRRELFQAMGDFPALAIDSLDWAWKKHPVIKISLNSENYSEGVNKLHNILSFEIDSQAKKLGVELTYESVNNRFKELIMKANEKAGERVVVIVDEYDKPLIGTVDIPEIHAKLREELKAFYGIFKDFGKYLRFTFITGVSKFAHVSIFSDLNNIKDMTFDTNYADLCGLTQEEVEQNFDPEIRSAIEETRKSSETYLQELKDFYDGYRFTKKPLNVYNPFGLLLHFDSKSDFMPYWFDSGSPNFLIKLITNQNINILKLEKMQIGFENFKKFDLEDMDALAVLYQTGYLTIKDFDAKLQKITLDYPNIEVRSSFAKSLLKLYLRPPVQNANDLMLFLPEALYEGDIDKALTTIKIYLASIPYYIIDDKEKYFQTAIHLIFTIFGLLCRSEVRTATGRIDTLVETDNHIYCFEFKMDEPAEKALAQINSKEYLLPYQNKGKKLFKIGVCFDSNERNIKEWVVECK